MDTPLRKSEDSKSMKASPSFNHSRENLAPILARCEREGIFVAQILMNAVAETDPLPEPTSR
jgi:hypothetical protein